MDENEEILQNKDLIFYTIKKMHLYWKTDDEFQEYVDAGYDGLLRGIRNYVEDKGVKKSTYYYTCIKFAICTIIAKKNREKEKMHRTALSLNVSVDDLNENEVIELIPSDYDIEEEMLKKDRLETIIKKINKLPIEKDRHVIKYLFGLDGYPLKNCNEIARMWNVDKNVICVRRDRALKILREKLKGEEL